MKSRVERAKEIGDEIRRILFFHWDPIGVSSDPEWPRDEYDGYAGSVYRILASGGTEYELIEYLNQTEKVQIGMPARDREMLRPVAKKLLEIDIKL